MCLNVQLSIRYSNLARAIQRKEAIHPQHPLRVNLRRFRLRPSTTAISSEAELNSTLLDRLTHHVYILEMNGETVNWNTVASINKINKMNWIQTLRKTYGQSKFRRNTAKFFVLYF